MSSEKESFYNIFEYCGMMHDAFDFGLCYQSCIITKDIQLPSGWKLRKGDEYEQVNFLLKEEKFEFIRWYVKDHQHPQYLLPVGKIEIPQKELAPFLHWNT